MAWPPICLWPCGGQPWNREVTCPVLQRPAVETSCNFPSLALQGLSGFTEVNHKRGKYSFPGLALQDLSGTEEASHGRGITAATAGSTFMSASEQSSCRRGVVHISQSGSPGTGQPCGGQPWKRGCSLPSLTPQGLFSSVEVSHGR